jgi:hypothetical protein
VSQQVPKARASERVTGNQLRPENLRDRVFVDIGLDFVRFFARLRVGFDEHRLLRFLENARTCRSTCDLSLADSFDRPFRSFPFVTTFVLQWLRFMA